MTFSSKPSLRREGSGQRALHALVVDDSAVVRQVMTQILERGAGFSVATASDPVIARSKIRAMRPDVIVLDLELPRIDGLTFLQEIMSEDPIPVVICSGLAGPGTEAALRAVDAGAIEVVAKPQLGVREFLEDSAVALIDAVRAAASAKVRRRGFPVAAVPTVADRPRTERSAPQLRTTTDKVVVLGASTGGTEALRGVLRAMPPDGPAIVIVQHMPAQFTTAYARALDQQCNIEVKEAEDGDRVYEGRALIAPGNLHTRLARSGAHYVVRVSEGELVSRHRPSVNVLFESVARAAGPNALGVIMTGMGDDGADGLLEMKRAGATTFAQDEASCVVYGMPKEAAARGAVGEVVPLDHLASSILRWAKRQRM